MICPNCGTNNIDVSSFCIKCGFNLKNIQPTNSNMDNPLMQNEKTMNYQQEHSIQEINNNLQQPIQQTYNQPAQNLNTYQNMQPNNNCNITDNTKKSKKSIILIVIIVVAAVTVLLVGVLFFKNINSDNKSGKSIEESLTASSSFFLRNSDGLYALFNLDGKQLTEFNFESVSSFVNATAIVTNKDDQRGVISTSGKMIINYGTCKYLYQEGPIYNCIDEENYNNIIDSSGKIILKEKNLDVISSIGEYQYVIIEDKNANKYTVYDYKGNALTSFAVADSSDVDSPTSSSVENFVAIFYNNMNYIFDVAKSKLVLSFEDEHHFCINKVNENNNEELTLSDCSYWYSGVEEYIYKFVKNGKVIYTKNSKSAGDLYFEGNNVIFSDDFKYILDEQGNNAVKINYTIFKDYKNYINQSDGIQNGAELYVNGQLKETIKCNNIQGGYAKHGVYLLDGCSGYGNGKKIFIKYDGTRINDKSYKRAYAFDENGYAVVSEDAQNYYLINLNGEKVSENYIANTIYAINGTENLYCGTNEDGTKSIFEINGDKLVTGEKISTQISNNIVYAIIENDDSYTIYDLKNDKEIVTVDTKPNTKSEYFTTSKDSKTQYYSYTTGKMFYEG